MAKLEIKPVLKHTSHEVDLFEVVVGKLVVKGPFKMQYHAKGWIRANGGAKKVKEMALSGYIYPPFSKP